MRQSISRFVGSLLFFLLLVPAIGWTGGPADVNKAGDPFRWRGEIRLVPDGDVLGKFNHDQATSTIAEAIAIWENVASAEIPDITLSKDPFEDNITSANIDSFRLLNDSITPVIFDDDGSIINRFCPETDRACKGRVIGLAIDNVLVDDPVKGPTIKEGAIILNGLFFNGVEGDALEELSAEALVEVIVHELGHLLGLDHSQLNTSSFFSSSYERDPDPTNDVELPTMFPFLFGEYKSLHLDDRAAITALYPKVGIVLGTIQGQILFGHEPDRHAFQGANVVVRKVTGQDVEGRPIGSRIDAVSAVSGVRFLAGDPVAPLALKGLYEAAGLPAGEYVVEVEPIDPDFRGQSSVGPLDPPLPMPARAEFYNGGMESDKRTDRPNDKVAVSVGSSAIDIILNLRPDPIPISTGAGSEGSPAVAFDDQGNYLVVWEDTRSCNTPRPSLNPPFSFSECSYDIFGARVSSSGVVLDKTGFPISTAIGHQVYPRVSFAKESGRYLVVWTDTRNGENRFSLSATDVYGALVDTSNGTPMVLPDGLPISAELTAGNEWSANVASNGTDFMAVFKGRGYVLATRVTFAGEVLDTFLAGVRDSRIFVGDIGGRGSPAVAFGNGVYLVSTGSHYSNSLDKSYSYSLTPVTSGGAVLGSHGIDTGFLEKMETLDIAFGGDRFLTVWSMESRFREDRFDPLTGDRIMGGVISAMGIGGGEEVLPFQISERRGGVYGPRVGWDGTLFVAVWGKNETAKFGESDIFGARVSSNGALDPQDLEVMTDMRGQGNVALAFGAGKFLVVWSDLRRLYVPPHFDIYGQLMTFPGLVIAPSRLDFVTSRGGSAPAQHLILEEPTGVSEPTQWAVQSTPTWLTVSLSSGQTPADISVAVNTSTLSEGKYAGEIVFQIGPTGPTGTATATTTVPVTLLVKDLRLEIDSGNGQEVKVGDPYLEPLVVRVGLPGVALSWAVKGGASFLSFATSTDPLGLAQATVKTGPNAEVNEYTVTCAACREDAKKVIFHGAGMEMKITLEKKSVLPRPLGVGIAPNQSKVTVEVLPVEVGKNREVTLKVKSAVGGGHDAGHATSSRPTGSFEDLGRGECLTELIFGREIKTPIDKDGKMTTTYTSCEISGFEPIEASIKLETPVGDPERPPLTATTTIAVEVPGLTELLKAPQFYKLAGGAPPSLHSLKVNHFALIKTVIHTVAIAVGYKEATGNILKINDMSLPMGGLFDIGGDWRPTRADCEARPREKGHCTHRDGQDVDIGKAVVDPATQEETDILCDNDHNLRGVIEAFARKLQTNSPRLHCESEGRKHIDFD